MIKSDRSIRTGLLMPFAEYYLKPKLALIVSENWHGRSTSFSVDVRYLRKKL